MQDMYFIHMIRIDGIMTFDADNAECSFGIMSMRAVSGVHAQDTTGRPSLDVWIFNND